jgi:hypothetical protein
MAMPPDEREYREESKGDRKLLVGVAVTCLIASLAVYLVWRRNQVRIRKDYETRIFRARCAVQNSHTMLAGKRRFVSTVLVCENALNALEALLLAEKELPASGLTAARRQELEAGIPPVKSAARLWCRKGLEAMAETLRDPAEAFAAPPAGEKDYRRALAVMKSLEAMGGFTPPLPSCDPLRAEVEKRLAELTRVRELGVGELAGLLASERPPIGPLKLTGWRSRRHTLVVTTKKRSDLRTSRTLQVYGIVVSDEARRAYEAAWKRLDLRRRDLAAATSMLLARKEPAASLDEVRELARDVNRLLAEIDSESTTRVLPGVVVMLPREMESEVDGGAIVKDKSSGASGPKFPSVYKPFSLGERFGVKLPATLASVEQAIAKLKRMAAAPVDLAEELPKAGDISLVARTRPDYDRLVERYNEYVELYNAEQERQLRHTVPWSLKEAARFMEKFAPGKAFVRYSVRGRAVLIPDFARESFKEMLEAKPPRMMLRPDATGGKPESAGAPGTPSPAELIRTILACSKAKKYDALKERICAVPLGPLGVLTRDVAIQNIMDQDKSDTGDFSYSDEAAEILLKEHVGKFSAEIPDGWMDNMKHEDFSIPELRKLALEGKDNFRVLIHGKVFVLVARVSGEYKLVFSAGLNHLLKE